MNPRNTLCSAVVVAMWVAALFLSTPTAGVAQVAGSLDLAFNPNAVGGGIRGLAVQADGKIVVGGLFTAIGGQPRTRIARLLPDGTAEPTATFDAGTGANNTVETVVLQSDGKILIGGSFTMVNSQPRSLIARLNANGSLEAPATFAASFNGTLSGLAVQPDGKIVAGGTFTTASGQSRAGIARLHPDGTAESLATFNPGTGANGAVRSVVVQPDGKIVLAGNFTTINGVSRNRIARLNADGTLDAAFNPGSGANTEVFCALVQPDGKIVLLGTFTSVNSVTRNRIARLNYDGTLDATFNASADDQVLAGALQADGKIVLVGRFGNINGQPRGRIARLLGNGTVESLTTFNVGTGTSPGPSGNFVTSVALQPDGGILIGGGISAVNGVTRNFIARLHNDAATESLTIPDRTRVQWARGGAGPEAQQATFELSTDGGANWSALGAATRIAGGWERTGLSLPANGQIRPRARCTYGQFNGNAGLIETVAAFGPLGPIEEGFDPDPNGEISGIAVQPDGKILIAGRISVAGGKARNRLARLNADGSLDTSFNPVVGPLNAGSRGFIQVQSDEKILLGGTFTTVNGMARNRVARINVDGSLDSGFDPNPNGGLCIPILQGDGKVILIGDFSVIGGVTRNQIARVNADGSLDAGFVPNVNGAINLVSPVDGKILIAGCFTSVNGTTRNRIARLNDDGTLDLAFDPDANESVFTLAVQADGKIVIGGFFTAVGGVTRNHLARLNPDGSLDLAFNPDVSTVVGTTTLQADGKILIDASSGTIGGVPRSGFSRINSDGSLDSTFDAPTSSQIGLCLQQDGRVLSWVAGRLDTSTGVKQGTLLRLANDPAPHSLTVPDVSRVQWLRGGSSPEAREVTFELSTDAGSSWTLLGVGTRVSGGWEKTGLSLPASGHIRARGRVSSGHGNRSSGLTEKIVPFGSASLVPEIAIEQPTGTALVDGVSSVNFGSVRTGFPADLTFTIRNRGFSFLTGLGITINGPNAAQFSVVANPFPPVGGSDGSTAFTLRFTPASVGAKAAILHVASNDADEDPFEIALSGTGASFTPGQVSATSDPMANRRAYAIAVKPDGKTILGGQFFTVGGVVRHHLARLDRFGIVDASFNPDTNDWVWSAAVLPDGKILIGGDFTSVGGVVRNRIARLHANWACPGLMDTLGAAGWDKTTP